MEKRPSNGMLSIVSHGISDRGIARKENEDAFWKSDTLKVYAVADGLGGLPHGEIASMQAVSKIGEVLTTQQKTNLAELFQVINQEIMIKGRELDPDVLGMATTLTVGRIQNDELEIAHAGDTGVMVYRDYQLSQITEDHTMDGDYRKKFDLDKHAPLPAYYQNILTNCLGTSSEIEVAQYKFKVKKGDKIIFFSDGLTKVIDEETLCTQMQNAKTPEALASSLVRLSNLKGAPDNVTVIAVYVL